MHTLVQFFTDQEDNFTDMEIIYSNGSAFIDIISKVEDDSHVSCLNIYLSLSTSRTFGNVY